MCDIGDDNWTDMIELLVHDFNGKVRIILYSAYYRCADHADPDHTDHKINLKIENEESTMVTLKINISMNIQLNFIN